MNCARSFSECGGVGESPLGAQQLELFDIVLGEDRGGAFDPAAAEDDGPPGVAPDELAAH
jgi:hypothetical protein